MASENQLLKRVYGLKGPQECETLYDDWARSYDSDMANVTGYVAPELAAARLADMVGTDVEVFDAGCGTGLAGVALANRGFSKIDGVDISPEMLAVARDKGCYRDLGVADLTKPIDAPDNRYGAVLCIGTLTHGHVGPAAVDELVRVAKPGAPVIATVHEGVWEKDGFREHIEKLCAGGGARLVEANEAPYHKNESINCRLVILEAA